MGNVYKYNRRSIRLKHSDYSRAGYYFVTICTQDRLHLFGEILDGKMVLNDAGEMVEKWHIKLEEKFPNVKNHEMVIMPNHIHFIIEIVGADPCVRPNLNTETLDIQFKIENMQCNTIDMQCKTWDTQSQRADTRVCPYQSNIYAIYDKISPI